MPVKALLVGGGGRENAIAKRLSESSTILSVMKNNNPGIAFLSKKVCLASETDAGKIVEFALKEKPDFAFIGPDAAIGAGIADALEKNGVPCVGATQKAGLLETNKLFCRQFLQDNGIHCNPDFFVFDSYADAADFLNGMEKAVIKPLGLTGGKGVKVMGEQVSRDEAKEYAKTLIEKDGIILVEECLEGEEFSLQAFASGSGLAEMPLAQDHKRAFENDVGPNTGGMGSYSDANHLLPFITLEEKNRALKIMKQTVKALDKNGVKFKGILYGQFMLTKGGPKLIEYNARFADPESINALPLLQTDLTGLCWKIIDGSLGEKDAVFESKASVVKYLVPEGYPENPLKGFEVKVDENKIKEAGGEVYYAAASEQDGKIIATGSRTIAVFGKGKDIQQALEITHKAAEAIEGKLYYRKDIGTRELVQKRIEHMRALRA